MGGCINETNNNYALKVPKTTLDIDKMKEAAMIGDEHSEMKESDDQIGDLNVVGKMDLPVNGLTSSPMGWEEIIMNTRPLELGQLLSLSLDCSGISPRTMLKHFSLVKPFDVESTEWSDQDLNTCKKILGFNFHYAHNRYGINKKNGASEGFPHVDRWQVLMRGEASLQEYADVFSFLNQRPKKLPKPTIPTIKSQKKMKNGRKEMDKREQIRQERGDAMHLREFERLNWRREKKEERMVKLQTMSPDQMLGLYMKARKESKMPIEKLSLMSNTSRYAIEAIQNKTMFDTYTAARLLYFILTNQDIDDSEYKDSPKEVFVDYSLGRTFRFKNNVKRPRNKKIENPKAYNLPLYLKK